MSLSRHDAGILILLLAFVFGTVFRVVPAYVAGFPINDGGMFLSMIEDLRSNHYRIPAFTSYNGGTIPYAYPPLGFFLGAAVADVFRLTSAVEVLRWVPGVLNALSVPVFHRLAEQTLGDRLKAQVATLVFALTPHLTSWWSMGGGLTRALGVLVMLRALTDIQRVFVAGRARDTVLAALFLGLTFLSHLEAALYGVMIAGVLWLVTARNARAFWHGTAVLAGAIAITIPWVVSVLSVHGLEPFVSAGRTGGTSSAIGLLRLLNIDAAADEPLLHVISVFGFAGMVLLVIQRKWLLPLMLLTICLVNPRSAHNVGNIPLALAAACFVVDVLLPAVARITERASAYRRFAALLFPYMLANSVLYAALLTRHRVDIGERRAMEWVKAETPEDSTFLVVTGEDMAFCDAVAEWFPALSGRRSVLTLQGSEWLQDFGDISAAGRRLQACPGEGVSCVEREMVQTGLNVDYLYVSLHTQSRRCETTGVTSANRALVRAVDSENRMHPVFRSEAAVIYSTRR